MVAHDWPRIGDGSHDVPPTIANAPWQHGSLRQFVVIPWLPECGGMARHPSQLAPPASRMVAHKGLVNPISALPGQRLLRVELEGCEAGVQPTFAHQR